jgi:hypothetical protein
MYVLEFGFIVTILVEENAAWCLMVHESHDESQKLIDSHLFCPTTKNE